MNILNLVEFQHQNQNNEHIKSGRISEGGTNIVQHKCRTNVQQMKNT